MYDMILLCGFRHDMRVKNAGVRIIESAGRFIRTAKITDLTGRLSDTHSKCVFGYIGNR